MIRAVRERRRRQVSDLSPISVVALVFIEQDGKILLAKQNTGNRYWSLPGGKMEPGEPVDETARREVKEETGLDVRVGRVVGLYSKPVADGLVVCFAGEVVAIGRGQRCEGLSLRFRLSPWSRDQGED